MQAHIYMYWVEPHKYEWSGNIICPCGCVITPYTPRPYPPPTTLTTPEYSGVIDIDILGGAPKYEWSGYMYKDTIPRPSATPTTIEYGAGTHIHIYGWSQMNMSGQEM